MGDENQLPPPPDTGLRRMLLWTLAALIAALVMAFVAVTLVFRWWGW